MHQLRNFSYDRRIFISKTSPTSASIAEQPFSAVTCVRTVGSTTSHSPCFANLAQFGRAGSRDDLPPPAPEAFRLTGRIQTTAARGLANAIRDVEPLLPLPTPLAIIIQAAHDFIQAIAAQGLANAIRDVEPPLPLPTPLAIIIQAAHDFSGRQQADDVYAFEAQWLRENLLWILVPFGFQWT